MSKVFWDTNLFVYLLENYPGLSEKVFELRARMVARRDQLCTSTLTLGELLVKPIETRNLELQARYRELLRTGSVIVPFDETAASAYAMIRSDRSIRAPDAIQLACASAAGVDLFLTNDNRLSQKALPSIQFVASLDRAPI